MNHFQIEDAILDEAIAELSTLHDWLRWTTSQFASSGIFFGHG
ncbi:MAG TPA: 50S ribosomal protein L3 N(5)-glutamine methyltransferase, partial [Pseudoalteromonas sp.]|nr:50S ribosomal protein L3 N(5)-glutamine methyltransferase [Pseudoalteromonas sp.]